MLSNLNIKIFADGADKAAMLGLYEEPFIQGLTTNPTLMRRAGISDYKAFCKDVLLTIKSKPISFEVFSDDFSEMKRQAYEIASWGSNVYVKIPITNTKNESSAPLIQELSSNHVKVNVTAVMSIDQVRLAAGSLSPSVPSYISIFAGRIADTGRNPVPIISESVKITKHLPLCELIWASPREVLNIFEADSVGCHVITVTKDILKKLTLLGYDLEEFSLDTVKMFYDDARSAGYSL